jgi:hypothetical protein
MYLMDQLKGGPEVLNWSTYDANGNGGLFKCYTQRLFRRSDFDILFSKTSQDGVVDAIIESPEDLDFQFWHKRSGHSFWVVCSYMENILENMTDWGLLHPLRLSEQLYEAVWPEKVYYVVGCGGKPLRPSSMFSIPLDELEGFSLNADVIDEYERDPAQPFDYSMSRLI